MAKVDRKEFMKLGLGAVAGATALGCGMGMNGSEEDGTVIHIHGVLPDADTGGGPVRIDITVVGTESDLSGTGWDVVLPENESLDTWCLYNQAGSVEHDKLSLQGLALAVNDPDTLGTPVKTEVDLKTGEATWTFGPIPKGPYGGTTFINAGQVTVATKGVKVRVAAGAAGDERGTPEKPASGM